MGLARIPEKLPQVGIRRGALDDGYAADVFFIFAE